MLPALAALTSAMDVLQSLSSSKSSSSPATGFSQAAANPFDLSGAAAATSATPGQASGAGGLSPLSPATMSALLAAQSQASTAATAAPADPNAALNDLFSQLDANHDGTISQKEFGEALGAGGTNLAQADRVFGKLDKSGKGISIDDLSSALRGRGRHHHSHAAGSTNSGAANTDPLLQALSGASSNSVTNSDGSTTTSITYADGSRVTMTSPAAKASSSSATSPYNFLEQMIAREAQAMSSGASQSLSISV
jgi:hypothetical protein